MATSPYPSLSPSPALHKFTSLFQSSTFDMFGFFFLNYIINLSLCLPSSPANAFHSCFLPTINLFLQLISLLFLISIYLLPTYHNILYSLCLLSMIFDSLPYFIPLAIHSINHFLILVILISNSAKSVMLKNDLL